MAENKNEKWLSHADEKQFSALGLKEHNKSLVEEFMINAEKARLRIGINFHLDHEFMLI